MGDIPRDPLPHLLRFSKFHTPDTHSDARRFLQLPCGVSDLKTAQDACLPQQWENHPYCAACPFRQLGAGLPAFGQPARHAAKKDCAESEDSAQC